MANFIKENGSEAMQNRLQDQSSQDRLIDHEFAEPLPIGPSGLDLGLDLESAPGALAEAETADPTHDPVCVRLDVEDLPCFAVVDHQYAAWGVRFSNAIAIRPSNPAYPPHSGSMVLFGAPNYGWIEATFARPVQHVSSFVTGSRRTVMRAFNRHDQLVAQAESPAANLQSPNSSDAPATACRPNLRLSLDGRNIHKVTVQSYNGHVTIDDFCFCG